MKQFIITLETHRRVPLKIKDSLKKIDNPPQWTGEVENQEIGTGQTVFNGKLSMSQHP